MAPTVPNEPSCSKRITRSKKLTDKEEHTASDTIANKTPSALDLVAKQVPKKKKINVEQVNETEMLDSLHTEKHNEELNLDIHVEFDKENHNPQVNQEQIEEQLEKKIKVDHEEKQQSIPDVKMWDSLLVNRCEYCKQKINYDLILYQGHPNGAVEEQIALTDPRLCLFTGDESFIHESDERPQNKLTYFR